MSGDKYAAGWWLPEFEGRRHDALLSTVRLIRQNQPGRKLQDMLHASLYGNTPLLGYGWSALQRPMPVTSARLSLNVVRNMVGAVTSKIAAKNRPRVAFQTEGGDWELKTKAQKLEKFVAGVFYESGFYADCPTIFRDCTIFGTGHVKVYADDGAVCIERAFTPEVVCDDGESQYGKPPNIYQRKYYDKRALRAVAKDDWECSDDVLAIIDAAKPDVEDYELGYQTTSNQVLVTEGWHLPNSRDADDGMHVIAIEGATLLEEPYEEREYPLVPLRWTPPLLGYFGVGLAEELIGIQTEVNKLLLEIQRGHHLVKGHYLVENGSKVVSAHLNNDLATLVRYTGTAPVYQAPSVISPEIYQHLWNLYQRAYEICGISQLSATSQKPAGLDSAIALTTYDDIQTERFLEVGHAYEEFVLDVGRRVIACARQIGKGLKVKARSKNTMETIDWADVDMDADSYVMKVYPTSQLPSTPAGKRQWVSDMFKLGAMPPEDILEIVDWPDTEKYVKRANAGRSTIEYRLSQMLGHGIYRPPEPFDNHKLALRIVNDAYHEAQEEKYPEERLEMLREYMKATKVELDALAPPPAPPAPMMGAGGPPPMPGPGPAMPPPGMAA